jgi:tetratricopeptide (TPR) repeat protein
MKRKLYLPGVVFTVILLSLTPGESTLIAAAKPLQENWEVYLKQGDEHYAAQRYTEALGAYREAVRLKPDHSKAHFGLINTYSKLNRSEEAVAIQASRCHQTERCRGPLRSGPVLWFV